MNATRASNVEVNPDGAALRQKAIESITLAIELFNRPSSTARSESVLMLFHHGFEMLLKSLIVERTGTAIDNARGYSYTFDTCLQIAAEQLKLITKDHRCFLSMLDNVRDSAVHYYQDVSEGILYIFAQGSVSLFDQLLRASTDQGLLDFLPGRVLPLSSIPPKEVGQLVDDEFSRLQQVLSRPDMTRQQAMAALRPLMAFKIGGEARHRRMTTRELEVAIENLRAAENWRVTFPEIAKLEFCSEGDGIPIGFKVVKNDPNAIPVRVLKAGDEEEPRGTIIHREINILDKFNLGLGSLADNLGITTARALAMIREYRIQEDRESFRTIEIGATRIKRYSKRALDALRAKLDTVEKVWEKHRRRKRK